MDHLFQPPSTPAKVILDTDMATDCDDAGAMAVLHTLARKGEAEVLAIVANNRDEHSIGAVAAINRYYGREDIPLGAYKGTEVGIEAHAFVRELALQAQLGSVPDAIEVYRRILGTAREGEVVIISIGHLNNLAGLLDSPPDAHSPLPGRELVKRKVAHLVVMGGDYPSGKEHNFFARGSAPSTQSALRDWPGPVLFSGYTLGERVMTGPGLEVLPESHPVRFAYQQHGSKPLQNGRPSWDQTAVLAAVRGPAPYWKLSSPGMNLISEDGSNVWKEDAEGSHYHLIERAAPQEVASAIHELMLG